MTRKVFLTMLAVASMAVAAEPTAAEKANLDVVTRFCAAFATRDMAKIGEFLAADVVYRITDTAPTVKGAEAVARIKAYVEQSTAIDFKILDQWARGSDRKSTRLNSSH